MTFPQKINALFLISGKKDRGEQGGGGEGQRVRQVQVGSAPAYFENDNNNNFSIFLQYFEVWIYERRLHLLKAQEN